MYLHKQKKKDGDLYLSIKEKYHVPKVGSRERTVESLGYLSKLKTEYDDPIAYFDAYAKKLTAQKKVEKMKTLTIDMAETLEIDECDARNLGYGILKRIYRELELDKFWSWKTRNRKMQFSTDQIFRLLTFSRALQPGSKRFTLNNKNFFFESFDDVSLDDIYHALDVISENQQALQTWIFEHSQKLLKRDLSVSYFDCTNYYFDIGAPDLDGCDENGNPTEIKYRKRGPEKNHRPDPIVQMGLLIDKNGIPVAYDLFPGNESEKVHMRPLINRVKADINDCRIIFVADRGLNTSDNIYWLNGDNKGENNPRDGYVYGQSVRGASEEFQAWLLDSRGYVTETIADSNGDAITFRHKSRIFPKELHVNVTKPGQKKPVKKTVSIDQKQMVYYSEKYARKQRREREIMVARAKDLIAHPKKYDKITSKGSASYILNIAFDKTTGEIVEGKDLQIDEAKIAEEAKFDGYYSIVTSELEMSDIKMHETYRGLSRIEDSFKVTKTYFNSRPVYVRQNSHIEGHFATCFMALVLVRILESMLGEKIPTGKLLASLKKYNCTMMEPALWKITYYDKVLEECGKIFDWKFNQKYRTQQELRRFLKY